MGGNRLTMRGARGEIGIGSEEVVRVGRMVGEGGREGGEQERRVVKEGSLAICLDVEEKTVDRFNYG